MNWHLKLSNVQSVSLGNNGGFSPSSYPTRNSGKFVPLPGILPSRVEAENYRRKSTETAGSAILASSLEFFFFFALGKGGLTSLILHPAFTRGRWSLFYKHFRLQDTFLPESVRAVRGIFPKFL